MDYEAIFDNIKFFIQDRLIHILVGTAFLVFGLILAVLFVSLIRVLIIRRLRLNANFAKLTGRMTPLFNIEKLLVGAIFLIVLLVIGFFAAQMAEFESLHETLGWVLNELWQLGFEVARAVLPLIFGLTIAFLTSKGIFWAGKKFKLDERIGARLDDRDPSNFSLTKSLSDIGYGVAFFLCMPMIFSGFQVGEFFMPLKPLFEEIVNFIPNAFSAIGIVIIGWLIAKITKQIFESVLASAGLDGFISKVGAEKALGNLKLSKLISAVVYAVLITVFVLQGLKYLKLDVVTLPLESVLTQVTDRLPTLALAIVIMLFGIYFGRMVSKFVSDVLTDIGFNNVLQKLGFAEFDTGKTTPSEIVGLLTYYSIVLTLLIQALESLNMVSISLVIQRVVGRAGDVLLGILVFGIGLYIANIVANWIKTSTAKSAALLAYVTKGVIIALTSAMALQEMGIADEIVRITFTLAMGSLALGIAIAIGLGSKDTVGQLVKDLVDRLK